MKKIISILVVGIFILSALSATALLETKTSTSSRDELDQSQTVMTENAAVPVGNVPIPDNPICVQVAQSFIPTKDVLTRVELFIVKNSTATYSLTISIREELTEDDLTVINIDPSQVPTEDYDWVEINFDDITVTTGLTYYIVALTVNVTDNFYAWGANNISESYPDGCMWYSLDEGDNWTNESASPYPSSIESLNNQGAQPIFEDVVTWDMCFKTYGETNDPPDMPTIEGPTSGSAGVEYDWTFYSIDPNGHNLYYWIDWGDGSPAVEWAGEFVSGEHVVFSHTYAQQGEFQISAKSKDVYDLEGDWAYLTVTMPRNRAMINSFFQRILQQFPNAFLLIRQILGF